MGRLGLGVGAFAAGTVIGSALTAPYYGYAYAGLCLCRRLHLCARLHLRLRPRLPVQVCTRLLVRICTRLLCAGLLPLLVKDQHKSASPGLKGSGLLHVRTVQR